MTTKSRLVRWAGKALSRRAAKPTAPAHRPEPPAGPRAYRGDFTGRADITYAPRADGLADPGEVVWAWVPYEEDATRGKDRPVLVIAMTGEDLLGLMLTSKDHDRRPDADRWFDIGTGAWDRQGRPSEVRLDRVLRLAPSAVRREGAALDRDRFDQVSAAARRALGW
ncbi:type II toxin-antitoxin system PemK/MazF family toxin [soil metagenome]